MAVSNAGTETGQTGWVRDGSLKSEVCERLDLNAYMEPGRGCARGARAFPGRCASRRGGRELKAPWEPGARSGRCFSGGGECVAGVDAGRGEKRLEERGWEAQAGFRDASGFLDCAMFRETQGYTLDYGTREK